MEKKQATFSCIDHSAPKGEVKMQLDINPILSAISGLEAAIREHKDKKPEIVQVVPVVNVPDLPITVNLPEMSPTVEVHPSEVVIQRQDGTTSPISPVVHVHFDIRPLAWILSTVPIIMLVDLVLRLK